MKGVILAAGRGSRLDDVTKSNNKCLYKIAGQPIIYYGLSEISALDFITEIIIVVGYKADSVINEIGASYGGKKITYCHQTEQKGLINALETVKEAVGAEDFMLFLGDEFVYQNNYKEGCKQFLESGSYCLIGAVEVEDLDQIKKTYTFKGEMDGRLTAFEEKPELPFNNMMGTGNGFFRNEVLAYLDKVPPNAKRGERELVGLFELLVSLGKRIEHYNLAKYYVNLNTPSDVQFLEKLVNKNTEEMNNGKNAIYK